MPAAVMLRKLTLTAPYYNCYLAASTEYLSKEQVHGKN
jgi:hypothetical protein